MRLKPITNQRLVNELQRTTATVQPDKLLRRLGFVGEYSWIKRQSIYYGLPIAILVTGSGHAYNIVSLHYSQHRKYYISTHFLTGKGAYKLLSLGLINHKELRQCLSVH